jgi:hypothetical protein
VKTDPVRYAVVFATAGLLSPSFFNRNAKVKLS